MTHSINIVDVFADAITVYADQVAVGDRVFDVFGNTYEVTCTSKYTKRVRIARSDGWSDTFEHGCEVTIVPGDGDKGRGLDKSSNGSRQGYIETGRYSSVNEEREINPESHEED